VQIAVQISVQVAGWDELETAKVQGPSSLARADGGE
jgi:hypothetical protein